VVDAQGRVVAEFQFEHSQAGWKAFAQKIKAYPGLAVAIETSQGSAVDQLLQCECAVYPLNPLAAKRYRDRKSPSGNKTDRADAWAFADALRVDGHGWSVLQPLDSLTQQLRLLCRDEMALIEQRTALVNQLQQALSEYYPAALEAFDDWTQSYCWESKPKRAAGTASSTNTNSGARKPRKSDWKSSREPTGFAVPRPSAPPKVCWL
jgi:transposase